MVILIIVAALTILISANCSLYESVLYSTRLGTLETAKKDPKRAGLAKNFIHMKTNISRPIASILIMNTIANTAGATIAGMYASEIFGTSLVIVFSIILTLSILYFSEIIPKTVGAIYWRNLWPFVVYPMKFLEKALLPLVYITQKFSNFITSDQKQTTFTEDEILAVVSIGAKEGQISDQESKLVKNIINLEEGDLKSVLTPRTMMFSLDSAITVPEAFKIAENRGFSRIPVYEEDKENILGYVMLSDLYSPENKKSKLIEILRPVNFVDETTNLLVQLLAFLKGRSQIVIVNDEYDGLSGLVTLEDIIETMLGTEIVDENDQFIDMQEAARERKIRKDNKRNKRNI